MNSEDVVMALPLTVYAVNMRYNVREPYADKVGYNGVVVFVVDQFTRAGKHPLSEDQVLVEARDRVEGDEIKAGQFTDKRFAEIYEFGGDWSFTSTVVHPTPPEVLTNAQVG